MEKRAIIKKEAKKILEGKWARCIISFAIMIAFGLIIMLIGSIADMIIADIGFASADIVISVIDIATVILIALVTIAYLLGEKGKYFAMADGVIPDVTDSMHFLSIKGIWHTLKVYFAIFVRILLWAVIFALPFAAIYGGYYAADYFKYSGLELPLNILAAGYAVFYVFAVLTSAQRYFLVPYISATDTSLKLSQVCKTSVSKMKGNKLRIVACKLSFILWTLLAFLILPLLYTVPYYNMVLAVYAKKIHNN